MRKKFLGPGVILLASIITALFNYFKIPIQVYQQIVAVFIGVVVILYSHFLTTSKEFPKFLLLFSSTLIVQLLIISSGGLLSPFLILYYIYALGLSFFNLQSSMAFLILTVIDFAFYVILNPDQLNLIRNDPGTMLLYGASLLAIIPLSRLLATKYQIKVELVQTLSTKLKLGDTILESLDELVIVTDRNFNIISVNGAVERRLLASKSEILRRPLFDVLFLRNQNGIQLNEQYMQSSNLHTQQSLNLENIFLYSKNSAFPKQVLMRVKPTLSVEGQIDQVTFIIGDADHPIQESGEKIDLEGINMREQAVIEDLKNKLAAKGLLPERGMVELLSRMSQDFATINQLTNHLYEVKPCLIDIAQVTEKSVVVSTDFAQSLKVKLTYELKQDNQEKVNQLIPQGFSITARDLTSPYFTGSVDIKWFDYLLQKLIDLSILLSSEKSGGGVQVSVTEYSKTELLLIFQTSFSSLTEEQQKDLFMPFYGSIPATTLKLGSGVEGYLVKKLSEIMKLNLTVESVKGPGLRFKLLVNRLTPLSN